MEWYEWDLNCDFNMNIVVPVDLHGYHMMIAWAIIGLSTVAYKKPEPHVATSVIMGIISD